LVITVKGAVVNLTEKQLLLLVEMQNSRTGFVNRIDSTPADLRVLSTLVKKGLSENIMDTFWKLTDAGRQALSGAQGNLDVA
jgi:hypothetical protein